MPVKGFEFRPGDTLIIRPKENDTTDPEALARAGQRCTFRRHTVGPLGTFAVVDFEPDGRWFFFRLVDLMKEKGTE